MGTVGVSEALISDCINYIANELVRDGLLTMIKMETDYCQISKNGKMNVRIL